MAGYSIFVREYGSDHDVALAQVDSNPEPICEGLKRKMLTIRRSILSLGSAFIRFKNIQTFELLTTGKSNGRSGRGIGVRQISSKTR